MHCATRRATTATATKKTLHKIYPADAEADERVHCPGCLTLYRSYSRLSVSYYNITNILLYMLSGELMNAA